MLFGKALHYAVKKKSDGDGPPGNFVLEDCYATLASAICTKVILPRCSTIISSQALCKAVSFLQKVVSKFQLVQNAEILLLTSVANPRYHIIPIVRELHKLRTQLYRKDREGCDGGDFALSIKEGVDFMNWIV